MQQKCKVVSMLVTAGIVVGIYLALCYWTKWYPTFAGGTWQWHAGYFFVWALEFNAFFGFGADQFRGSNLVKRQWVQSPLHGLDIANMLIGHALGICLIIALLPAAPEQDTENIRKIIFAVSESYMYTAVAYALLCSLLGLFVRNRFVAVVGTGNWLELLNGSIIYPGEQFRRWPFCPIEHTKVPNGNNVGGTIAVSCKDGNVSVHTGPLYLTRSFEGVRAAGRRSIDQDGLAVAERVWLHDHLKREWKKLTVAQVLRWEGAVLETQIQDVRVRWDGKLNPSLHRPE